MAIADEKGWNVDTTLRYLTDDVAIRIPMMPGQRKRWTAAADDAGMLLPVWVVARVESAMQYGSDRGTIERMYKSITELKAYFGLGDAP